jgi:hypothetical protein
MVNLVPSVALGNSSSQPFDHLIYLSLPIGCSFRHTSLFLDQLKRPISTAYGSIVSYKLQFNRMLLTSLYNAIAIPHLLYATLFWKLLTKTDEHKIRSLFFGFAKYLFRLPPWYSNSKIDAKFKVVDPEIKVAGQIAKK